MLNIASPLIEEEEIKAVNDVLRSGMLAQGPKVAELEKKWAEYCGTKYAVAVNSGTAAIHSALFAAGVGPGDEVITVPFSFIATVNPIIMLGAKPVFVDIDPDTFNMNVSQIERVITDHTKAIMPVHLYGQTADMLEIKNIADKHGIDVVEDACQAIGAEYKGNKAGNLGDAGCFSLYATKNIMSGEGGVVTTNNKEYADAIKRFRQHGMSGPYQYEHIGYNYRTTDLCATIAIEQLKKVDDFNGARRANATYLTDALSGIEQIELPVLGDDRTHVYHQYTVAIKEDSSIKRDEVVAKLREAGVGAGVYYPQPLHLIPHIALYGYEEGDFPITEGVCQRVFSLPIHPSVSDDDLVTIANAMKAIFHD